MNVLQAAGCLVWHSVKLAKYFQFASTLHIHSGALQVENAQTGSTSLHQVHYVGTVVELAKEGHFSG